LIWFCIRKLRGGNVRSFPIRSPQPAAPEVGEDAKARQARFYFVPGRAQMGRHHVHLDRLHECFGSPPKAGLALRGKQVARLFAGRIHLGALYMVFERKALWVQGRAMIFLQFC
jgi:hypothetical protein